MSKGEYTGCMAPKLKGIPKGISKKERGDKFCEISKVCSGKAATEAEARQMCANRPAKAPKAPHAHRHHREFYDPDEGAPSIPDGYEVAGDED
jgi:hypothetical protein